MGFFRNLMRKSVELDMLDRQNAILEGEVAKLKWERDENAKQVIAERNKRDRDANRFNQTVTKLAGADPRVFVEPKVLEEPKPLPLSQQQLDSIRYMAQAMLDDDVANGEIPLPLEHYEDLIISKSDEYLPMIAE